MISGKRLLEEQNPLSIPRDFVAKTRKIKPSSKRDCIILTTLYTVHFNFTYIWSSIYSYRTCVAYGWGEGVYRVLVGKAEGRRPPWRHRRRWVDNIRMDLREVGCGYMDWIGLAQDRDRWWTLVSAVTKLRVPWNAGRGGISWPAANQLASQEGICTVEWVSK